MGSVGSVGSASPKFSGSLAFLAAMAKGSMPQAVHKGALTPARACTAIGVLRDTPAESRLQNNSGASAVTLICTWRAVVPSADEPFGSVPRAPATVAK